MRTLLLAAAVMAAAPTAAEAAVTISFTGSNGGTGRIVIDTAHLGSVAAQADGSFRYSGDGSAFLTASFTDATGQLLLQSGTLDGYIDYSVFNGATQSTIEVGYSGVDAAGTDISSNLTLLGDDASLATFDGIRLPDFRRATSVNFLVDGADGSSTYDTAARLAITTDSAPAVPEPATWAMMIAGFALVGGALRRRRAAVAFA